MPNVEWAVKHVLQTPYGELNFNVPDPVTHRLYQIADTDYKIIPTLRATQDNRSETDGSELHPRWKTGLLATIRIIYAIRTDSSTGTTGEFVEACDQDLQEMHALLMKYLNVIRQEVGTQRLRWYPTGYGDQRMLDNIQCLAWPDPSFAAPFTDVVFTLESPFPYAIDLTQTLTSLTGGSGGGHNLVNVGSSDFMPVIKVYGPTTFFVITNNSVLDSDGNPLELVYDGTRPGAFPIGGGHYVEFDFFRGTAFLDGSGADRIAGVDPTLSDFFPLQPGDNVLTIAGADCDVLWNAAWS